MKSKIKLLTAVAGLSLITPIITTLSACSKTSDYTTVSNIIKEDAVKEFTALCPIYRQTFKTRRICDYLKKRVTELGLGDSLKEDGYRAIEYGVKNSSGNLTFEIPATKGLESMEKVMVQAHMDMVCKSDDPAYDWDANGVIPVRDGDKIHSQGHKTTLGADDGIGLGIILSLAKHRDEYTHGPIRAIITADEEDGKSGASEVGREWLDGAYLVNLDGEVATDLTTSCAGDLEARFEHGFTPIDLLDGTHDNLNQYKIQVTGLSGGHSGLKIGDNRINAVTLMVDLMNYIFNAPFGANNIYLIDAYSPGSFTVIPSEITFTFATTAQGDVLADYIEPFANYMKFMHPIESGLKITGFKLDDTPGKEKQQFSLSEDDTRSVIEYISLLPYGPLYYNPETGDIQTSCNYGGAVGAKMGSDESCFCLEHREVDGGSTQSLIFGIQGRSSIPEHLGPNPAGQTYDYGFFYYFVNATKHVFIDPKPAPQPEITDFMDPNKTSWLPPWPYKPTKLWDILIKGSTQNKHPLTAKGVLAWAETAYFAYHQPSLNIACIGCDMIDVHEPEETLYVNTVQPVVYNLLYLFDNLPKPFKGGQ